MRNVIAALLTLPFATAGPLFAGPAQDLLAAETILKSIEIAVESAKAASDRANTAFIAIMSRKPESPAMSGYSNVGDCTERLLAVAPIEFHSKCKVDRSTEEDWESTLYITDEQLEARGCFTRAEADAAGCGGIFGDCQEPVPESVLQISDSELVACIVNSPRPKHLYDRLYDLFVDEEIERRLEELKPAERDAIRPLIQSTDV